jgi:hypothetical protein
MSTHPSPRPRLYLDVDGVLNAEVPLFDDVQTVAVTEDHGAGYRTEYQITWSPTVVRSLEAMRQDFDLELVWLTTWLESKTLIDQLTAAVGGLAGGRRLVMPPRKLGGFISASWKRDALLADLKRDPATYVWADDVEVVIHGPFVKAGFPAVESLHVAPSDEHGLTAEHLVEIRTFLEGL